MINLVAPINPLSYGYVSSEILTHLSKYEKVCLFPIGPISCNKKYVEAVQEAINNQTYWSGKNPSLKIYHEFDLALHAGSPTYAFPFFEIDTLDERRINHLKGQDQVIVPTKWAAEILSQYNINSRVVPLGVSEEFTPVQQNTNKCIFATVGKWEVRKGHDILHKLFARAFPKETDVELWCFCENHPLEREELEKWKNNYRVELNNRVKLFPRQDSILQYLQMTTCGIFISRAEGWNLGCLEMMALGKQVIATNYSGHTEYCTSENSYLIDITEKEPAYDGKWFHGFGNWAKLGNQQQEQIIESLRDVYSKFHENKTFNSAGVKTAELFTFERTAKDIYGIIRSVH